MTRSAALVAGVAVALAACGTPAPSPPPAWRPAISVTIEWAGRAAAEIDGTLGGVSVPLAAVPGVRAVRSRAERGRATFELAGEGIDVAAVRATLVRLEPILPPGASAPSIELAQPGATPVLVALVDDGRAPAAELGERLDTLATGAGLRLRERCGDAAPELQVTVDPARAAALGLTLLDLIEPVETAVGGGRGRAGAGAAGALGDLMLRDGVRLSDLATISLERQPPCAARLDGKAAVLAVIERAPTAVLPASVRLLDGRSLTGTIAATPETVGRLTAALRAAIVPPRWFATRFEADRGALTVAVGLAPGVRGDDVATAIEHALGALGNHSQIHWHGDQVTIAATIVRGPDARTDGPTRLAALRANPAVASAGCEPCGVHTTLAVRFTGARLAAIGVEPSDLARLVELGRSGVTLGGQPPVRLGVSEGADPSSLSVRDRDGVLIALSSLLTMEAVTLPDAYLRVDGEPAVELWARGAPGVSPAALRALVVSGGEPR